MNVSMRAKAIYELSRAMGIDMTKASKMLEGMSESVKKRSKVS